MIEIDGTIGEGGGQVLRTSLALSMVTKAPFHIVNIRGKRRKTGLLRQHLTAVRAAVEICNGTAVGDELASEELTFSPGKIAAGNYEFEIGSAGSTSLVLQTILPALAMADGESTVKIAGGTHNPMAPPFDFLRLSFFPLIRKMGVEVAAKILTPGFAPAGGGLVSFRVKPSKKISPIHLTRGEVLGSEVRCEVSNLPMSIAKREMKMVLHHLESEPHKAEAVEVDGPGPGNVVFATVKNKNVTSVFTEFGRVGLAGDTVAFRVARQVNQYLETEGAACEHLADQLLLWLGLAGGGSFTTVRPTMHTRTQAKIMELFLPVRVKSQEYPLYWQFEVMPLI